MAKIIGYIAFLTKKPFKKIRSILRYTNLKIRVRRNISPIKIIVGTARSGQRGWLATDESFLDFLRSLDWKGLFKPHTIDALLAEHIWEHFTKGIKSSKSMLQIPKKGWLFTRSRS